MASGDITFYNKYRLASQDLSTLSSMPVDLDTDTIKMILLDNTHTVDTGDSTVDEHLDDVSADEVATGTEYTGPITLANVTVALNSGVVEFKADDILLVQDGGGGFTDARYAVLYKDSGVEATSPLICSLDLGEDRDNTLGDLLFKWASGVVFTVV